MRKLRPTTSTVLRTYTVHGEIAHTQFKKTVKTPKKVYEYIR